MTCVPPVKVVCPLTLVRSQDDLISLCFPVSTRNKSLDPKFFHATFNTSKYATFTNSKSIIFKAKLSEKAWFHTFFSWKIL